MNPMELTIKGIKCDNLNCDYKNEDVLLSDYDKWLNKPCPKCGENLLTQEDYDSVKALFNAVGFLNSFLPKQQDNEEKHTFSIEMNGTGKMDFKQK